MAVTIWQSSLVTHHDVEIVSETTRVSVAVFKDGEVIQLRFKRTTATGAWPPDDDSHVVTPCANKFHFIRRRSGVLFVGEGKTLFLRSNGFAPRSSDDWTELEVIME